MNSKTAKLIRQYCSARGVAIADQRKRWQDAPRTERDALRAEMVAVVRRSKEGNRAARARALAASRPKVSDPAELAEIDRRIAKLSEPYRSRA